MERSQRNNSPHSIWSGRQAKNKTSLKIQSCEKTIFRHSSFPKCANCFLTGKMKPALNDNDCAVASWFSIVYYLAVCIGLMSFIHQTIRNHFNFFSINREIQAYAEWISPKPITMAKSTHRDQKPYLSFTIVSSAWESFTYAIERTENQFYWQLAERTWC